MTVKKIQQLKPQVKAIVLRTIRLKETLAFFTDQLEFSISESSPTHFVIHSRGTRILFIKTNDEPGIEIYLNKTPGQGYKILEDPNHIKIVIS